MIDLTWTTQRFVSPSVAQKRVMVVVDRDSANWRLVEKLAPPAAVPPATIVWLWVVTPSAVVSWGALMAEHGDRTRLLLAALGERMEEARRCMTPLQQACNRIEIPCQTHILHGTVAESAVRLARGEAVDQVLLASVGESIYGQPTQELAATLSQRLTMPVGIFE